MKRNRIKWFVLGGLVLLAAGGVLADYNVSDHTTYKQNASTGAVVNSTGDAKVEVVNGGSAFEVFEPALLNCTLAGRANGGLPPAPAVLQDSSAAVPTKGAKWLALMMYPTFDDSVSAVALAIQYRWHYSATVDSQSTFIEQATNEFRAAAGATVRDSIGSFLFQPVASNGISRYSVGAAAVANSDSLATPDEKVLVLTNVSGVARGRMIRITPPNGPSGSAGGPYFSVRVRYLNGYGTTAFIPFGNGASGLEPRMLLRVDLVGGR